MSAIREPLSARELRVLALLALGLTQVQIHDRLHISARTVTLAIREKLGAATTVQAVALAFAPQGFVGAPEGDPLGRLFVAVQRPVPAAPDPVMELLAAVGRTVAGRQVG